MLDKTDFFIILLVIKTKILSDILLSSQLNLNKFMVPIRKKYVYKKDDKALTLIARGQKKIKSKKCIIFNVDYRPGS